MISEIIFVSRILTQIMEILLMALTPRLEFQVPNSIHPTILLNKFSKFAIDKKQMSITNQAELNVKGCFKLVSSKQSTE